MSCLNSYKVDLIQCPNTIKVWGSLLANTNYAWILTDKLGNEYYEYVVTGADGSFTIDCTASIFPDGLFNYNAGAFTLEVFRFYPYVYIEETGSPFTFCNATYDSITINFIKSNTSQNTLNQHIKCQ